MHPGGLSAPPEKMAAICLKMTAAGPLPKASAEGSCLLPRWIHFFFFFSFNWSVIALQYCVKFLLYNFDQVYVCVYIYISWPSWASLPHPYVFLINSFLSQIKQEEAVADITIDLQVFFFAKGGPLPEQPPGCLRSSRAGQDPPGWEQNPSVSTSSHFSLRLFNHLTFTRRQVVKSKS